MSNAHVVAKAQIEQRQEKGWNARSHLKDQGCKQKDCENLVVKDIDSLKLLWDIIRFRCPGGFCQCTRCPGIAW